MEISSIERKIQEYWDKFKPHSIKGDQEMEFLLAEAQKTGNPWLMTKWWGPYEVDYELKEEWLHKLNFHGRKAGIRVLSVCYGHPFHISGMSPGSNNHPTIVLISTGEEQANAIASVVTLANATIVEVDEINGRWVVRIKTSITHNGQNQKILDQWWESVVESFESFCQWNAK